jgi:hypothetical protein
MKSFNFESALRQVETLLTNLSENVKAVGTVVAGMLKFDRSRTVAELAARGLPKQTVLRLELVGKGVLDPRVYSNGTAAGELAETLSIKEQRRLLDVGCLTLVGGPTEKPVVKRLKLGELNDYNAEWLIDSKRGKIRTVNEQLKARSVKLLSRKKPPIEFKNRIVRFNQRDWSAVELAQVIKDLHKFLAQNSNEPGPVPPQGTSR